MREIAIGRGIKSAPCILRNPRYSWVSLPIEFPIPQISRVTVSMLTDELRETIFRKGRKQSISDYLPENLFEKSMENHFWRFGVLLPTAPLVFLKAGAQCAPYKCTFQTGSESNNSLNLDESRKSILG